MRAFVLSVLLFCAIALGAQGQVLMRGDVDYFVVGSRVRIEVEEITNFGETTTDRLRFRLWASRDRWNPSERGRVIAISLLPRLQPHENRHDLHPRVHFHRPGRWYFVTLILEERTVDSGGNPKWDIRDVVDFGADYFREPFNPLWPF